MLMCKWTINSETSKPSEFNLDILTFENEAFKWKYLYYNFIFVLYNTILFFVFNTFIE